MRRIAVIMTLAALLGMTAAAAPAGPAFAAGRGGGWVFQDFGPGFTTTDCGFLIVATQTADKVFAKTATAPDGSTVTVFTGHHVVEPSEQQERRDQHKRPVHADAER